jgi:uncharacterized protein YerC
MDRNLKLSVIDSFRTAKLQALQERLTALKELEEMAEVKTSAQVRMLKIQAMPEQAQAAKLLADELAKRAALLKLTKLTGKLDSIISKKEV